MNIFTRNVFIQMSLKNLFTLHEHPKTQSQVAHFDSTKKVKPNRTDHSFCYVTFYQCAKLYRSNNVHVETSNPRTSPNNSQHYIGYKNTGKIVSVEIILTLKKLTYNA